MSILDKLGKEIVYIDGALGTMIQLEAPDIIVPDELNIERPELLKKLHAMYLGAGANVITTNTFGANDYKLIESKYTVEDIITSGVQNAREVAKSAYVALDIGPLGKMIEPLGKVTFNEAYEQFKKQVVAGAKAGCDLILIETMSDILEAKIAILAAKENCDLPVICTMTFNENGKTFTGVDPIAMVAVLEGLGVDALGVNCSFGPDKLMPIVEKIIEYASIPIVVQPNAGLPIMKDNKVTYDIDKETFALYIRQMVELGVSIVGGCCGTSPEHIAQCVKILKGMELKKQESKDLTIVTSARSGVVFENITVIGEALVPTGRKKYTQALEKGKDMFFYSSAKQQKKLGAQIININVSTPGIDENAAMIKGVKRISSSVDIPLQIDSIHPHIIEQALRYYPGKAIINSVNGTEESMNKIFPIAKKYGACVIAMTFDESGLFQSVESRLDIAKNIIERAAKYEISKKDIIIDCLSLSAKAYQDRLLDTLELVSRVKCEIGVQTMLGVSNISYGLPERSILDRTYLAMALSRGLDIVMMSVYDKEMIETIDAFNVISNIDKSAINYRTKYSPEDNIADHIQLANNQLKILLASVKGDTVNNGKDVLKEELQQVGYQVQDLGLNVEKDEILHKATEEKVDLIGLSAFAPTSLESLEDTVAYIRKHDRSIKIMVGGASVNEEFAKHIGADLYAKDAIETIKKLEELRY
ncbi:homocysteine methyltransferase [Alkalibaculum sp. M08DMB]|uniref:Methionine synthase n=1 Tax=Alkalibaculum sporogenes TaxID=2655001 RepID=A0A6A7K682_9FIRM|nr:homocysteine S-methyltransferase family protein [Alkalibaculum sporogenes]MPW24874.1 homocysteine methyltransferase [Alkalibaculum sporogenes]